MFSMGVGLLVLEAQEGQQDHAQNGTIPPQDFLLLASINAWMKLQNREIPPIVVSLG